MATSTTFTYNITAAGIITEALRKCAVLEEGGTASSTQISDALPVFESMMKALSNRGIHLWTNQEFTITLVADQYTYDSSDLAAIDYWRVITDLIYRDSSGNDTYSIQISRQEYYELADKDQTSNLPTQFYWERAKVEDSSITAQKNTLYIWPAPNDTIAGDTLIVRAQTQLQDITADTNNIATPQEYLEAIEHQLAVRLAPHYRVPLEERIWIKQEATEALNLALSADVEETSIYLQPRRIQVR